MKVPEWSPTIFHFFITFYFKNYNSGDEPQIFQNIENQNVKPSVI